MGYQKELGILVAILLVDLFVFLLVAPALTPDVPPDFWQFLTIFFALLAVYSAAVTGLFEWLFRTGKRHRHVLLSLLPKSLSGAEDQGASEETPSDTG
ncbi:MAG TPA: hypothetical protein VGS11_04495 [Candidatus Bathyarchaeia archaeon]|nr:hypothetical protein [Candidatus Bathyarchaeia archaeon]